MLHFWGTINRILHYTSGVLWSGQARSSEERACLNSWGYIMKLFMPESTWLWAQLSKVGDFKRQTRVNPKIPSQLLDGSYPHPQTAGSCRSPPLHPSTRPSEQGPGIPTPLEWTWCPHPQRSTVSEMKAYFTNRCSRGFLFSHEMRKGERGKGQFR